MLVAVRVESDAAGLPSNPPITRYRYQILMCMRIRPVYEVDRPVPGIERIIPVLTRVSRKTAQSSCFLAYDAVV